MLAAKAIKILEDEFVDALYAQRAYEMRILAYRPQASAPAELRKSLLSSTLAVRAIELKIRRLRHSF
jgi:hypothetical protein